MSKFVKVELKSGGLPRSRFFAARLRARRVQCWLRQEELAQILGVSRSALTQWELGKTEPSLAMIEKVAEALAVTPEYLMFGTGAPDQSQEHPSVPQDSGQN